MSRGEEGPIGPHFADLMTQAVTASPFTNQNMVVRDRALSFVGALFPNARACRFEVSSFCRDLVCFMLHVSGWSGRFLHVLTEEAAVCVLFSLQALPSSIPRALAGRFA